MTITLQEAALSLDKIIYEAEQKHEEVVLTRNNIAVAKLTPLNNSPAEKTPRKPGSAKGLVMIAPDFDAPLDDFKEYE